MASNLLKDEIWDLHCWCHKKGYPYRVAFNLDVIHIDAPRYGFAVSHRELAINGDIARLLDYRDERARAAHGQGDTAREGQGL